MMMSAWKETGFSMLSVWHGNGIDSGKHGKEAKK